MKKVIIAGSRNYDDYHNLVTICDTVIDNDDEIQIVSGRATGADQLGEHYALQRDYFLKLFPADWEMYGNYAGPVRNKQMAEYADVLIAFPLGESKGTQNMIKQALKNKLEIYVADGLQVKRIN